MLSLLQTTLLLVATTAAFPLQSRDIQWSFNLFPTAQCNGTGHLESGPGSTGCRANLPSIAAAYHVTSIADDCRIEFFDNTMCDTPSVQEPTDLVSSSANVQACRIPSTQHRYGSYRVTCDRNDHNEI
ncbi:hypothetical protein N7492_009975 [Penicillium capsulatum]|uniref:Uncharacterized protein n=1 Tax=Penicillium capsulatum TaxID=69766 RepID=A0A9W9HMW4_9EURO|nr:hypothetical protein N7492_009975 [Penicillium capsulatum]KAJ6112485.1 hypothetical protein N7512_007809 [Penicillium capsulatum]